MTILFGVKCKEGIVMAADKLLMHTQTGTRQDIRKLYYASNKPVVVSSAGSSYVSMWESYQGKFLELSERVSVSELVERDIPVLHNEINAFLKKNSDQVDFFGVLPIPILHLDFLVGAYHDGRFRLFKQKYDERELREVRELHAVFSPDGEDYHVEVKPDIELSKAIELGKRVVADFGNRHYDSCSGVDLVHVSQYGATLVYTKQPKDLGKKTRETPDEELTRLLEE